MEWVISFMKIKDYLASRSLFIVLCLICNLLVYLLLDVSHIPPSILWFILIAFNTVIIIDLIVQYVQKHFYYKQLFDTLHQLDHKYLIAELLQEPTFLEGKIFYEVLRILTKDMNDHINTYKFSQKEYKDYIEMWVHEIKTPIAAAKLLAENHANVPPQIKDELNQIEDHVEQALYYARSTTLQKDYIIKKTSLHSIVSSVLKRYSKNFIYGNIQVELNNLDYDVYTDSKWMVFIVSQIVNNSLKYMNKPQSKVSFYAKKEENCVCFYIKDNGKGISEIDLPRIFDRGFTGMNGRENQVSTGMGLYLCKTLCTKMKLNIHCESKVEEGTTMCIVFPMNSYEQNVL